MAEYEKPSVIIHSSWVYRVHIVTVSIGICDSRGTRWKYRFARQTRINWLCNVHRRVTPPSHIGPPRYRHQRAHTFHQHNIHILYRHMAIMAVLSVCVSKYIWLSDALDCDPRKWQRILLAKYLLGAVQCAHTRVFRDGRAFHARALAWSIFWPCANMHAV